MADKFDFDAFLSHNSKDKPAVEQIARILRDEYQLKLWFDKWSLTPGKPWQEELEEGLEKSEAIAVFLGEAGFGRWENEEMRVAVNSRVNDPSRRVIPVLLPGAPDDPKLSMFLARYTWVDLRSGFDTKELLYRLYCGITGQPPGDHSSSPTITAKPETGSREAWNLAHPYPMPPNFTGRKTELEMLDDWLADDKDRLFILRALGGFGKSALAWQWINTHVNPAEWTRLVFWSFYEGDASFEHFIEETLKYLKLEVPQGQRPQVDELLKAMQGGKILLIMDGFERALRAYSSMNAAYQGDESPLPSGEGKGEGNQLDCVNINAEIFLKHLCSLPNIKSKVLMTTRLTPRAVKPRGEFMLGCREDELTAMQKADAVEFFHKQKIKGTHAEIEAACAPYGYHPLSLRLLAGRILKDFENPADIIVAQKFKIDGDIIQQKHHVLEVSYDSLPKHEQKLLSTIACFRSPVELDTLKAIAEIKDVLDNDLHDLVERGLLHFDEKNKKFDLHPIVRRYAYDRLTVSDRTIAHTHLRDYFAAVDIPAKPQTIEDLAPIIELYYHTVQAGLLDDAMDMYYHRLSRPAYFQFGSYQLQIELLGALFQNGQDRLPALKTENAQGWTLNSLANSYSFSGQPRHAVSIYQNAILLAEKTGNKKNFAIGLGAMAKAAQLPIGALRDAESNLRHSIDLCQEIKDETYEAVHHNYLSLILIYRSLWKEAEQELAKSTKYWVENSSSEGVCMDQSYQALSFILQARSSPQSKFTNLESAIKFAYRAFEIVNELTRTNLPLPRTYIRAYWLLGAAFCASGELTKAEEYLSKAISMCRQINMVDHEADILLDLAHLRYAQNNYQEAKSLAEEALLITERCGYVLQGADVNLFLAQFALEQEKDKAKAKVYAETALKLATCDGPPYYYKVAYEEAERMLEKL